MTFARAAVRTRTSVVVKSAGLLLLMDAEHGSGFSVARLAEAGAAPTSATATTAAGKAARRYRFMWLADLDPRAGTAGLEGIGAAHVNGLGSVEVVVVGDVVRVRAVQGGVVAVVRARVAAAAGVVDAGLDVLANHVDAITADL